MKQLMAVIVAGAITGCAPSTEIVKSWKELAVSLPPKDTCKSLIVALVKDEGSRRVIEDQLVKRIGPNCCLHLYYPGNAKGASNAQLSEKLEGGYNYILLMRLADIEKETSMYLEYNRFMVGMALLWIWRGMYSSP
jgi:hypothetical protein